MFCTIQKLTKKTPSQGNRKGLEVSSYTSKMPREEERTTYTYSYKERFDRQILDTYKISIHHSYRANCKVKKKQWVICTIGYYDLIEYSLDDFMPCDLEDKIEEMGISAEDFWTLLLNKVKPLQDKIIKEYQQTEEYKVTQKNKEIIDKHLKASAVFNTKYNNKIKYDNIYNVFGEIMNQDLLDRVEREYIDTQKQYQEYKNQQYNSSYQSNNYSNYKDLFNNTNNFTDEEKKEFKADI